MNHRPAADFLHALTPLFQSGASTVPVIVAGLIAVAVAVGLWCEFSLRRRYQRADAMLQRALAGLAGTITLADVQSAINHEIGVSPRGAGAFIHDYVERAVRRKAEFQPATAVELAGERERQLRRTAFVRWVIGTALVMGLAGTFIAFMQLVTGSGLMEALEALRNAPPSAAGGTLAPPDAYAQLSAAFAKIYAGFGYAFLASLAGLFGTMTLGFGNTLGVARARAQCLARMEDFGEDILRPLLVQTGRTYDDLGEALRNAAAMLGTSAQTMEALRETSGVLDRAARRFDESQGANSEMVVTLGKLATELENSHLRWNTLLEALRESRSNMAHAVEEFKKEAEVQREMTKVSTGEAIKGIRAVARDMAEQIKNVAAARTEHFASVQGDLQRMLLESKQDWDRVSTALLGKTDEAFKLSLAAVQDVIADSRRDAASARQEIAALTQETAGVVTVHGQVLAAHAQAVTDSLQQWSSAPLQVTAAVEAGRETLDKLSRTLDTLNDMPARWEKRVLGSIRQLDAKLDESTVQLARGNGLDRGWAELRTWLAKWRRG